MSICVWTSDTLLTFLKKIAQNVYFIERHIGSNIVYKLASEEARCTTQILQIPGFPFHAQCAVRGRQHSDDQHIRNRAEDVPGQIRR